MRFARHQQHPQFVAHAVDRDDRAVVDQRQFILQRRGLDLDDVRAGMLDVDVDTGGLAARERAFADHLAVAADHDLGAFAGDALIVEPVGDGLRLPDDAEARRGRDRDPAVALVLGPRDQRMDGRLEAERCGARRNVVHPPVGDQERAGDPVDRDIRQGRGQRAEQTGAVGLAVSLAGVDHADLQALDLLQGVDQRFLRLRGLLVAVAEILARALVDHDRDHRAQRFAVLAGE